MQLEVKRFTLASGAVGGLALFVVTLIAAGRGIGNSLSHLSAIFLGYNVTYLGSVVGLVYGFVSGLILGALFAVIYNGSTRAGSAGS
jgi:cell shape-determining protein MreD